MNITLYAMDNGGQQAIEMQEIRRENYRAHDIERGDNSALLNPTKKVRRWKSICCSDCSCSDCSCCDCLCCDCSCFDGCPDDKKIACFCIIFIAGMTSYLTAMWILTDKSVSQYPSDLHCLTCASKVMYCFDGHRTVQVPINCTRLSGDRDSVAVKFQHHSKEADRIFDMHRFLSGSNNCPGNYTCTEAPVVNSTMINGMCLVQNSTKKNK